MMITAKPILLSKWDPVVEQNRFFHIVICHVLCCWTPVKVSGCSIIAEEITFGGAATLLGLLDWNAAFFFVWHSSLLVAMAN